MKPSEVLTLCDEMRRAMRPFFASIFEEKLQAHDVEGGQWYRIIVANDFLPDPVSVAGFQERTPYGAETAVTESLDALVERGYFTRSGADYHLTSKALALIEEVNGAFHDALAELPGQVDVDLGRIADLLWPVVEGALQAPDPAEKPWLVVNRSSDPGPDGSPALRILQYLADIGSFRDDAHLASWGSLGVSGPAWEALTFIWREEANTAAALAERLATPRGFDADGYAGYLKELVNRGWIEPAAEDGAYQVTATGRAEREAAEERTDRVYYVAWEALSSADLEELANLVTAARDQLQALSPETAEPSA